MNIYTDRKKLIADVAFLGLETVIFFTFLALQLRTGDDPVALKYTGVVLCFAYALFCCLSKREYSYFIAGAMLFTCVSDMFIFVLDDYYEIGVTTFAVTQTVYFLMIYRLLGKKPYISLAIRLGSAATLICVLAVLGFLSPLTFIVSIYFTMLVFNAAESVRLIKISKKFILLTAGYLLFILCDVCVGVHHLDMLSVDIPAAMLDAVILLTWVFYLPSQTLIAFSVNANSQETSAV